MALHALERGGRIRLHVRIDERSAVVPRARPGQGEPPAGRRAVHVGHGGGELPPGGHRGRRVRRAAARADRRPAAGAARHRRQPDDRPGQAVRVAVRWYARGRSARARGRARRRTGGRWPARPGRRRPATAGAFPGPVHLNLPFRDPLVPDDDTAWVEPLDGRPGRRPPWTGRRRAARGSAHRGTAVDRARRLSSAATATTTRGPWSSWPSAAGLAGARRAVLGSPARPERADRLPVPAGVAPEFMAAHRPDVIVSAGRPGLSRPQSALLGLARSGAGPARRRRAGSRPVGRPAARGDRRRGGCSPDRGRPAPRTAGRLAGRLAARRRGGARRRGRGPGGHLRRGPADGQVLTEQLLTEPLLARELLAALPDGRCCGRGPACPSGTSISRCRRGRTFGCWPAGGRAGSTARSSSAMGAALAHAVAAAARAVRAARRPGAAARRGRAWRSDRASRGPTCAWSW